MHFKPYLIAIACLVQFHYDLHAQSLPGYGFIENQGQILDQDGCPNTAVQYLLPMGNGLNVQIRSGGFSYDTYKEMPEGSHGSPAFRMHRVDVEFLGALPGGQWSAEEAAPDYLLYYRDAASPQGTNVRHYRKLIYRNVYPHIDVEFFAQPGTDKPAEYNFVLHPGARVSDIQLRYTGMEGFSIADASLHLDLSLGCLRESIPASYWLDDRASLDIRYRIIHPFEQIKRQPGTATVGFSGWDTPLTAAMVIDPTPHLDWGTYYGGSGLDAGRGMALDAQGNAYAVGQTASINNIATAGVHQPVFSGQTDAVIVKFNSMGQRLWGAYYGGSGGDVAQGIAADLAGNLVIVGETQSATGIASPGAHQTVFGGVSDGFVLKLTPDGARLWATYFGGVALDFSNAVAVDMADNILITGWTESPSGIATAGTHQPTYSERADAFVAKFSSTGARLWGTYLGDTGFDLGLAIVADNAGNPVISGWTSSTSGIATPGRHQSIYGGGPADAFLVKFSGSTGARLWGTYLGGTEGEYGDGLYIDAANNLYMTGPGISPNGIATSGTHQSNYGGGPSDAFLVKFDPEGARLWGTYFGGPGAESGYGITVDPAGSGDIFISGFTNSGSNIATPGAHQETYGGGDFDAFLAKFNAAGALQWGSYYGGAGEDRGYGIATDAQKNTYLVGFTASANGVANSKGHQSVFGGGQSDLLVAKFADCYIPPAPQNTTPTDSLTICAGNRVLLRARGEGQLSWYDAPTGGNRLGLGDTLLTPILAITDTFYIQDSVCLASATRTPVVITVNALPAAPQAQNAAFCANQPIPVLSASAGLGAAVDWFSAATGGNLLRSNSFNFNPPSAGVYFAEARNTITGCVSSTRTPAQMTMHPSPGVQTGEDRQVCSGDSTLLTAIPAGGTAPYRLRWSNGDTTATITLRPLTTTTFTVTVTDGNSCTGTDQVNIQVNQGPTAVAGSDLAFCPGSSALLNGSATGGSTPYRFSWSTGQDTAIITVSPTSSRTYALSVTDRNGCIGKDSVRITVHPAPAANAGADVQVCAGTPATLSASGSGGTEPYRFAWSTGDTQADISVSPSSTQTYTITISDANDCMASDEVRVSVTPRPTAAIMGEPQVCAGGSLMLRASGGNAFLWSTGANSAQITVRPQTATTYQVVVSNGPACSDTARWDVRVVALPQINLPASLTLRLGENQQLEVGTGSSFSWAPSEGLSCDDCPNPILSARTKQRYCVFVEQDGCEASACVEVTVTDECPIYVPNAFSPNNDGFNDELCVYSGNCLENVTIQIYNRWGGLIYTSSPTECCCWDGRVNGVLQNTGMYVYRVTAMTTQGTPLSKVGEVMLLR